MIIHLDFETYSGVPIGKAGAFKYVESDDFEILLCAYSIDGLTVEILDLTTPEGKAKFNSEIKELLFRPDTVIAAYNAAFEAACIAKHFNLNITPEYAAKFRCTMLHGLYCGYTAGLDATGKALGLPEDKRKLSIGKSLIRYFCIPCNPTKTNGGRTRNLPKHDPDKWNLFKQYCAGDVVTEMEIERKLICFPVPDDIQKQWETDLVINARGVAVDMEFVRGALAISERTRAELMKEAVEITGLQNPNSVAQLSKWLESATGNPITDLRKDTVARMLGSKMTSGSAERMLQIRQELGKTSTKKYDAIQTTVCADNRVRGLLQFYGANRTGRYAGRLIQVQNLPRTYIDVKQLPLARETVKRCESEKLNVLFGSINNTLSQLIRTAFIAAEGKTLVDADFSSIEARIVAWLAREEWVLEVFRTHGKIYEATAAQMFNVPIEKIVKGSPEYALRQRGKLATLSLGYGGGAGALITMGALDLGIAEEDLQDIVTRWRQANSNIVQLWYKVEGAAMSTIQTGRQTSVNGLIFTREFDTAHDLDFLTIRLPSGRKLYYVHPEMTVNQWGNPSIAYYGVNQTTKQWTQLETYGGKIVENCLSGNTPVLTPKGWIPLKDISLDDEVWDGEQWVAHEGLINRGFQEVIDVDGVRMTSDHKIYTERGWRYASSSARYNRYEVTLPDSDRIPRIRRKKIVMENSLRLWQRIHNARQRVFERKAEILWLLEREIDKGITENSRAVKTPSVSCLAFNERTLYFAHSASMEKLRRSRNQNMRTLAGEFRELLERYGTQLSSRFNFRSNKCEWRLLSGKLQVDFDEKSSSEQTQKSQNKYTVGFDNSCRSSRKVRYWSNDIALSNKSRLSGKYVVHKTGIHEQVYDLKNAGPHHRFTVLSNSGAMLVHNCVQAIARDCLVLAIEKLESAGYPIVFHVHDEVVIECSKDKADLDDVIRIMTAPIPWAQDLPMKADGWVGDFFRKD